MMEIILKKRNIENVEERLKPIVMVLQDHEDVLSDGYGYYCGQDNVVAVLEKIARRIMDKLDEQ